MTVTSSHPSSPHWSKICLVAWISKGSVAYSHFCVSLMSLTVACAKSFATDLSLRYPVDCHHGQNNVHRIWCAQKQPRTVEIACFLWYLSTSGSPGSRHVAACRNARSEEHTSELQSRGHLVCRLLLEKTN